MWIVRTAKIKAVDGISIDPNSFFLFFFRINIGKRKEVVVLSNNSKLIQIRRKKSI